MLTDVTGGAGYAFGQVLTSSHMTTIATQLPNALDAINGGTYVPTAEIWLNNSSGFTLGWMTDSNWPKLSSREVQQWGCHLAEMSDYSTSSTSPYIGTAATNDWETDGSASTGTWLQKIFSTQPYIILELQTPPHGASATSVGAAFGDVGAGGDSGSPPQVVSVTLDVLTGIHTIGASPSVASSYKGTNFILEDAFAAPVVHTEAAPKRYFVACYGEAGAGAAIDEVYVRGAYIKYDITELRY